MLAVTSPVGRKMSCEMFYLQCRVQVGEFVMPADLIVLAMHDFDVILEMDWLPKYCACMDYLHKSVIFKIDESSTVVIFEGSKKRFHKTTIFEMGVISGSGCDT